MEILVINSGSSSLKIQLIDTQTNNSAIKITIERIGEEMGRVKLYRDKGDKKLQFDNVIPNHEKAMVLASKLLTDPEYGVIEHPDDIKIVGHRVVHGGEKLVRTTLINEEAKKELKRLIPLAPLHNAAHLEGINVAEKILKKAAHYIVMDTAFHQTMPEKAFRYAIPNEYYENHSIRAYGFHGTSHKYVDQKAREHLKNNNIKTITIHLGNGASMAAIDGNGRCIDTSMGFTALDGLIMGTRSGAIDPSVIFFMHEELGKSVKDIKNILNKKSGMLGLSGSQDARDVEVRASNGDASAILCQEMYAYRIQKYLGAYYAALNGVDAIVFTAGIGENDPLIRSLVCKNLEALGIVFDDKKNIAKNSPQTTMEIQAKTSKVKILVIPTNEELQIAKEIELVINQK